MAFTKITPDELTGKGVIGQPAVPGLSVEEMQKSVEQIVREVAIPGVNRLVDELGAESAASNVGMEVPSTMPPETEKTVQVIAQTHIEDQENPHKVTAEQVDAYTKDQTDQNVSDAVSSHADLKNNPHEVTAAQVGAYTKEETDNAIDQKVQAIGAADMSKAEFATNGEYGVVDKAKAAETSKTASAANDGVKVYTHTRSGTVNELTGTGPNGRALMTADVQEGDTWTVNGQPVTAYMGSEDATGSMAGSAYNGKWVSFIVEGKTLNFKCGGGKVTVTGLSADVVLAEKTVTVKQGAKEVVSVTGNIVAPSFAVGAGVFASNTRDSGYGGFYINENNQFVGFASYRGATVSGKCKVRKGQTLYWYNIGNCLTMNFGGGRSGTGSYTYQKDTIVSFTLQGGGGIGPDTARAHVL